ncbi:MAG: NOB1 family endonuclease [Thermoplasmata archaeon]
MGKKYILDTSVFLSGKSVPMDIEIIIPYSVINELKNQNKYSFLLERSKIVSPSEISLRIAQEAAKKTGDINKLSETDLDIIALSQEFDATVMTDDYAIQNVLKFLNVPYTGMAMKEIKENFKWVYRCTGCKRYFDKYYESCPVCGSPLKLIKKKL